MKNKLFSLLFLLSLCFYYMGCNPFAPEYDPDGLQNMQSLGNPVSIQGYFQLFKNSYELRDTSLYGRLFDSDFVFVYYDFDQGQEFTWDRATEMNISYKLFQASDQINLDWNFFTEQDTTDTTAFITRNFNLSISERDGNSYTGTGRAKFRLRRARSGDVWKAHYWFDDSDF
ncbi:MAG: hypothetical protein K1X92_07805 [Bacteroidia bacterium]|nr:hypothetical protein [Bacteroidia bacterium]